MISKFRILTTAIVIATAWFFFVTFISNKLPNINPIILFLIINGIGYAIPSFLAGRVLDPSTFFSRKAVGIFVLVGAVDLITPAYIVEKSGELICTTPFCLATIDSIMHDFWMLFNFQGSSLFILVYPITFILLVTLSLVLLSERDIKEAL